LDSKRKIYACRWRVYSCSIREFVRKKKPRKAGYIQYRFQFLANRSRLPFNNTKLLERHPLLRCWPKCTLIWWQVIEDLILLQMVSIEKNLRKKDWISCIRKSAPNRSSIGILPNYRTKNDFWELNFQYIYCINTDWPLIDEKEFWHKWRRGWLLCRIKNLFFEQIYNGAKLLARQHSCRHFLFNKSLFHELITPIR